MMPSEASPPDTRPSRRFRLNGWWWVGAIAFLLCSLPCAGWLWFTSRGDLAAVAREAHAAGLPTTWLEVGHPRSPPSVREAFARLASVMTAHRAYADTTYAPAPRIGEDLPGDMRAYLSAIPAEWWQGIERDLIALPTEPVVMEPALATRTLYSDIDFRRHFIRLMAELLCVVSREDLPHILHVACRAASFSESRCYFHLLITTSDISVITTRFTRRLPELVDAGERSRLADQLAELRQELWTSRLSAGQGEVVFELDSELNAPWVYSDVGIHLALPNNMLSWDDWKGAAKTDGITLFNRWNRSARTRRVLAAAMIDRDCPDLATRIQAFSRLARPDPGLVWLAQWCDEYALLTSDTVESVNNALTRNLITLDVLIAVLRDQPLPHDPYAPPGTPLKSVMRAGQRIGWYSVGPDGVDDGGDPRKDLGIPLYASFGSPRLADPPRPR